MKFRIYFSQKLNFTAFNEIILFFYFKKIVIQEAFRMKLFSMDFYRKHKQNSIMEIIGINSYVINPSCISNFYRDYVYDRATIASTHICITSAIPNVSGDLSSIDGKVELLNRSFAGWLWSTRRPGKIDRFRHGTSPFHGVFAKVIEDYRGQILIARFRGLCLTGGPRGKIGGQ